MENLATAKCGKLFCRLGCVCDSLEKAHNRSKVSLEHVLKGICGSKKGNPSIDSCVSSLLGSYQRRVERLSEDHLGVSPRRRQESGTLSNSSRISSPLNPPIHPANFSVAEPETQQVEQPVQPEVPEPPKVIKEQHEETNPRPAVETEEIFKVILLKRIKMEKKLAKIKQKVNRMKSDTNKLAKNKHGTAIVPWKRPVVSPSSSRSTERFDKIFSLLIQSIRNPGLGLSSNFGDLSALGEQPKSTSAPFTKPPELEMQNLEPIGSTSFTNIARRIRILPPPAKRVRRPPVLTKTFGRRKTFSSDEPAEKVSVPSSSVLLSDQFANQQMAPPVTQSEFVPDCQPKFPEAPRQQMEEIEPATPSEKFAFPNVVMAEVVSVQSNGNATLKIIVEELKDRNRELCPSRVNILLPLHNIEEQWGIVALDRIPKCGFRVPGLSVFIPGDVLGRAASTAVKRKTGICFPFRFQLKNKTIVFNPACGIYGNPELPRHVFVGPFPPKHFNKFPPQRCVALINPKKPVTFDSVSKEPTASLSSAENVQQEVSEHKDEPTEEKRFPESKMTADGVEKNPMDSEETVSAVEGPSSPSGPFSSGEILKNDTLENVKLQTRVNRALQEEENGSDPTDVGRQNENRAEEETSASSNYPIRRQLPRNIRRVSNQVMK